MAYYAIIARDLDTGRLFQCFTWKGSAKAGIARAHKDAQTFGRRIADVRAQKINL